MDNIAHTLVGAALGRATADRRLRYASVVGAVAANAPDWTELFIGLPADDASYLVLHRGITHSLAGAAVEIAALTAISWLAFRAFGRGRLIGLPLARSLAVCVTAAVLSHLYMDWQGSYGLRPFLPWSNQWYYGDFVAIVDVFFWIVPLIGLAWGAERHWKPAAGVAVPLAIALAATIIPSLVTGWVKAVAVGLVLLGVLGWMHYWFGPVARRASAACALAALAIYALLQALLSLPMKTLARQTAGERFGRSAEWAALTLIGRPFSWEAIYANHDSVAGSGWGVARHLDDPNVREALATREGRAMAAFARFLAAEVDSSGNNVAVFLRDARYRREGREGWAVLAVRLKKRPPI